MYKVDNAIIMAAGTSSRFAPLSFEKPKALIEVKGEILIERQIRQIKEAGINEIIVVTGYKAEQFNYLKEKFGVILIHNPDYLTRNNNSTIHVVSDYLKNSFICSSDNYFISNPFKKEVDESYYASIYIEGQTNEWCINEEDGWIKDVIVGGKDSWIMLGHVFWSQSFSETFLSILEKEYNMPETADKLWESIYIEHINELPMKIKKYRNDIIFEFDTLDELREFDPTYNSNTRSKIIKRIVLDLRCKEDEVHKVIAFKDKNNSAVGFTFNVAEKKYKYYYETEKMEEIK